VLDAGCGTGENALFFAGRGQRVTGIDFLPEPIRLARQKVAERGLTATFLVTDALALKELPEAFDRVIDTGLFQVFGDEDRRRYVAGLAAGLKPAGGCSCSASRTPSRAVSVTLSGSPLALSPAGDAP
jgi:cyclopropane fatty-acyl-phospholipid synthase-like methyltransferase